MKANEDNLVRLLKAARRDVKLRKRKESIADNRNSVRLISRLAKRQK